MLIGIMVSPQLDLPKNGVCKSFQTQVLFPASITDSVITDQVELDFSDIFGPVTMTSIEEIDEDSAIVENGEESSELVYDDPAVIYTRSHSLVGPSSCVSQSLKLGKLTLNDSVDSLEEMEHVAGETIKEVDESNGNIGEEFLDGDSKHHMQTESVSIEDFEILKFVGQGAFAKVYQVRKKGTSDIYAMKVMRKDKIMEKNHAEYMKAERDILTQIEHPFVVQLRYSFQVHILKLVILEFAVACLSLLV